MTAPIVPIPRSPICVRVATPADVPFIDSLQKQHTKQVGWMPTKQLETKIASGAVLAAEEEDWPQRHRDTEAGSNVERASVPLCLCGRNSPVGYVIATDRYMKREDCGIIYQMNVVPDRQRSLVAATLLKAVFERAAYGCRLFCCWCAQDLAANHFWQAMGFVPLAFRSGSRDKGRTHIFWQRRVRAGDCVTPYWFPSQTGGGSIREDRLVLPIPPGLEWSDEMPVVLPVEPAKLEAPRPKPIQQPKLRNVKPRALDIRAGGLRLATPNPPAAAEPVAKPKREKKPAAKNDPRLVAAARELRDRWLERVNADGNALASNARYDVSRSRQLPGDEAMPAGLLAHASAA